jgi:hypothetical protein
MRQGEYFLLFDSREGELHSIPDLLGPDVCTLLLCVEMCSIPNLLGFSCEGSMISSWISDLRLLVLVLLRSQKIPLYYSLVLLYLLEWQQ